MTRGIIRDGNNPQATKKHLRNHIETAQRSLGAACQDRTPAQCFARVEIRPRERIGPPNLI